MKMDWIPLQEMSESERRRQFDTDISTPVTEDEAYIWKWRSSKPELNLKSQPIYESLENQMFLNGLLFWYPHPNDIYNELK